MIWIFEQSEGKSFEPTPETINGICGTPNQMLTLKARWRKASLDDLSIKRDVRH